MGSDFEANMINNQWTGIKKKLWMDELSMTTFYVNLSSDVIFLYGYL